MNDLLLYQVNIPSFDVNKTRPCCNIFNFFGDCILIKRAHLSKWEFSELVALILSSDQVKLLILISDDIIKHQKLVEEGITWLRPITII